MPTKTIDEELSIGIRAARSLGFEPTAFRGGGLCQSTVVLRRLARFGFKVDSSVAWKLNEKRGWFQGHSGVPLKSWYWPSKNDYAVPAEVEERLGVLEVPVTRSVPSGASWFPYTLVPGMLSFPIVVSTWRKKVRETPLLTTPLFHSWGDGLHSLQRYELFLRKLRGNIEWLMKRRFKFMTVSEVLELICQRESEMA